MSVVVILSALLLFGPLEFWIGAAGTTRYVDDDTCPAAGSGSLSDPYCKIQDAICASVSGDTVSVARGTYNESLRMKPGVSLVSQEGPSVTTINGAGQPCTNTNYCAKNSGSQCSVVIFSSGHTSATTIEGFTITGGAGAILTQSIAGGGIYVFSSPTIRNNVITNNVLAGARRTFTGGGIHVEVGAPIITGNTISGNRAVPAAGTSTAPTYGYGGGIYVSFNTSPTITDNVISGNRAGDPNLAFSVGNGGGISIWGGDPNHPAPIVVDRNTIADNETDTMGGGVAMNSLPNTATLSIISNNVIVGNKASYGGGVYTYFNKSKTVNNTIVDNEARFGGGVYSGQGDPTLPVIISNNVIVGNRLRIGGDGGGIYTLDFSATFDPVFEANDFFNNQRDNVAGDKTDATVIGANGNFLADPDFVNQAGRDFHLLANSPAIDAALASRAPAVDRDNAARGYDGTGTPNAPQPGDNDVGAYEWRPGCVPTTEVCDGIDNDCNTQVDEGNPGGGLTCTTGLQGVCAAGTTACQGGGIVCGQDVQPSSEVCDNLDNNCDGAVDEGNPGGGSPCGSDVGECSSGLTQCQGGSIACAGEVGPQPEVCDNLDNDCNGLADNGFPNADGDSLADCVDPDDDNDGAGDGADCLPLDGTAFGWPDAVTNLSLTDGAPTPMTYDVQNIGSGTRYQIVSGLLSRLAITQGYAEDFCIAPGDTGGTWQDSRPSPPEADGWLYLIRAVNNCGAGTYGGPLIDQPRPSGACPGGIVDADVDGSPSDLDCNDADPNLSPIEPEICDGADNNCANGADEGNPGGGLACGTNVGDCEYGVTACLSGGIACTGGIGPGPESCDGHDNDCNGAADEGYLDTDGDLAADCVDPDDDGDGAFDAADCAPLNPGAFAVPTEVQNVEVLDTAPTQITWTNQATGAGTQYEVGTGVITTTGQITFSAGTCLPAVTSSPATDPGPAPLSGEAVYYLVKSRNACGPGTYGTPARDTHPACP